MIKAVYQESSFPHWHILPVRFRDLDPLNHVNNALYSTYYEEARIAFIQDVPSLSIQLNQQFSFVLAHLKIDFIHPVKYPAKLLIGSGILNVGNTSITSFQAIYHAQTKELASVAEARGVWIDLSQQRPATLPKIDDVAQLMVDVDEDA